MKLNLKNYTCQNFVYIEVNDDGDEEEKHSNSHIFIPDDDGEEILNETLCGKFSLTDDVEFGSILLWEEMDIRHGNLTCKDCLEVIKHHKLEIK